MVGAMEASASEWLQLSPSTEPEKALEEALGFLAELPVRYPKATAVVHFSGGPKVVDWTNHLNELEAIFGELQQVTIKINPDKIYVHPAHL